MPLFFLITNTTSTMEQLQRIIYQQKVNTTQTRILKSLSVAVATSVLYFLIKGNAITTAIVGLFSFGTFLFSTSKNFFDGIQISEDSLVLQKQKLFKEMETHQFQHSEIAKVFYSEGKYKKPRYAIFTHATTKQEYAVFISSSIFKFAYGLRAMKQKGVAIELQFSDNEIQLFLDGKIPDVPMTNEMTVK